MKTIVFMGTGFFALTALKKLLAKLGDTVRLVVFTKEDKPSGRGMQQKRGCVSDFALTEGLELHQPHTLREDEYGEVFRAIAPELCIVASYGLLLPKYILELPVLGCVNIHASLLPRYRGAAPINRCIMNGDRESGVTLMQMNEGLDTGDILMQKKIPVGESETAGELFDRLATLGAEMMLELLPDLFAGKVTPVKQNDAESCYASKITSETQIIDWKNKSEHIFNQIRGLAPFPGALCRDKCNKLLKITKAARTDEKHTGEYGTVFSVKPKVLVKTGDGALELLTVQPEGKSKMDASALVNGRKLSVGDVLT